MMQLNVREVKAWKHMQRKVQTKNPCKEHFSQHGKYKDERVNSSITWEDQELSNHFQSPTTKMTIVGQQ